MIGTDGSGLTRYRPAIPMEAVLMVYIFYRGQLGLQKQKVWFNQLPCPPLAS